MDDVQVTSFARTAQVISTRVLSESRRVYGAMVDETTLQTWVTVTLSRLLTEQTRVTTFVPVLAMRDIRELAERYQSQSAAA